MQSIFSLKNYSTFPNHTECDSTYLENKTYSELRRQSPFISTHLNTFCVHIERLQNLQQSDPEKNKPNKNVYTQFSTYVYFDLGM